MAEADSTGPHPVCTTRSTDQLRTSQQRAAIPEDSVPLPRQKRTFRGVYNAASRTFEHCLGADHSAPLSRVSFVAGQENLH